MLRNKCFLFLQKNPNFLSLKEIQFNQPKLFYSHIQFHELSLSERILMNYDLVNEDEDEESIDSIEETVQDEQGSGKVPEFDLEEATANLIREATELFIDGKWESFDYSKLDKSDEYIDFHQLERDEQEIYFQDE